MLSMLSTFGLVAAQAVASVSASPLQLLVAAGDNSSMPMNSTTTGSSSGSDILLGPINFAGYDNYLYRDNVTAAQVVLSSNASSTKPSRLIVAFPEGNTGALTYFIPSSSNASSSNSTSTNSTSSPLQVGLDSSSLSSVQNASNQTGIAGQLTLNSDVSLGVTLIGSVRTLRDYTEGSGLTHEIFNYTLGDYNSSHLQLVRNWINGTTMQYLTFDAVSNLNFSVTPSSNVTLPPTVIMTRQDQSMNGTLAFSTTFNYTESPTTNGAGLSPAQIFLTPNATTSSSSDSPAGLQKVLQAIQGGGGNSSSSANSSASSMSSSYGERPQEYSFLGYDSKFLAGGWRFLTYFGRDTLLALRLLLPTMTSDASEAILGAVLERLNTTGAICHEETIGDYASFVNINNNQSYLGNAPSYSYVMLDTDFLLLPSLAHYFLSTPQGQNRSQQFLSQQATLQNGSYAQLLQKNVDHVLNYSTPFSSSQKCTDLAQIRDPNVGNWRDSNTGLGGGKYPFDVNTALIPGALRAIASLASAGVLPSNYTQNATQQAQVWEQYAAPCFEISISQQEAQSRLESYIPAANLSSSLLYGDGSLNTTAASNSSSNATSTTMTNSTMSSANKTLYALSLDANGAAVEIQNSDLGFTLLYANNVSESVLQAVVDALQPYPKGLLTNVGMVVANPAYSSNTSDVDVFANIMYHGTVVWSWQQALMAQGIVNQLGRCGLANETRVDYVETTEGNAQPAWCNTTLVQDLQNAQTMLWNSIAGAPDVLYTEVWSPIWSNSTNQFSIGDLGAISPSGTEGDAVQLWSYAFLAQLDPRNGNAVASGMV